MGSAVQFLGPRIEENINLRRTNNLEVLQIIHNLKVKATSDINVTSIKNAAKINSKFNHVLANIINASLLEGKFPNTLKIAKVVPIHKGGSKLDIQNYRPISLLSAFSKIYEKLCIAVYMIFCPITKFL